MLNGLELDRRLGFLNGESCRMSVWAMVVRVVSTSSSLSMLLTWVRLPTGWDGFG